jgi:hypothetical protein
MRESPLVLTARLVTDADDAKPPGCNPLTPLEETVTAAIPVNVAGGAASGVVDDGK